MVPLAPDLDFVLLRHPLAREPLTAASNVTELVLPGETKSLATLLGVGWRHRFAETALYHAPAEIVPLGLRCPWVVTLHDLMWVEAPRLASAFLPVRVANGLWYRMNTLRAVRGARSIIAISHATAEAARRIYPEHATKVRVIHHGLDHERYTASRSAAAELPREVAACRRFSLAVGQGSPYKNHAGMVRAFVEATQGEPEHKLVLVRRFSRVDFEMRRLLSRRDVKDKVIALPFVGDDQLCELYRRAHMLLFASHYEGFGFPALEAMALGTPVLASTAAAVREVTASAALHAVSTDHADLVAQLRLLNRDDELRGRLIAAGHERAREFSWQRAASATLDVYRAALAGREPNAT
jgi:glycosyltransferase involved in cell wall biosynthesis